MSVATPTPARDGGPEPRTSQSVSRPCTVPSRRWRIAPNDLKIAPCTMSVPTANVGLKPKTITRIGVISEPPPIPVKPTIEPIRRPVSVNCQVTPPTSSGRDDRSRSDGVVRRLVDEDERPGLAVLGVQVDRERLREPQPYEAD